MPISSVCPACHSKLKVADRMIGREIECPGCGFRFIVPEPSMQLPAPTVHQPDWHEELPPVRIETLAPTFYSIPSPVENDSDTASGGADLDAQLDRGELTDLRCFDCGSRIYERELVRRDVEIGRRRSSSSSFDIGAGKFGRWDMLAASLGSTKGIVREYGHADLCLACSVARDQEALARKHAIMMRNKRAVIGCLVLAALFIFVACAGMLSQYLNSK
jgi:DNA-directed RNA polymerase subunit RPC12/RpoP